MENYNDFSDACDVLAYGITDRDFVFVKSLVMAAASLDASCSELVSVVRGICTLIDRFTGCGFLFVFSEVVKIHVKFFDD